MTFDGVAVKLLSPVTENVRECPPRRSQRKLTEFLSVAETFPVVV